MITFESIFSKRNVIKAIKYLSNPKSGTKNDRQTEAELISHWELNKHRILEEITTGKFKPNTIKEFEIINGKGKRRCVTNFEQSDKFITRLIAQKLNKFFAPLFQENSYAYQENKGTLSAVQKAKSYIEEGNKTVIEIDIKDYFDEINLEMLLDIIKQHTYDKKVHYLLEEYLYCTIVKDDEIYQKRKGILQGSAISPCLSNLYLNSFDQYLTQQQYKWIRFADNIYIYVESQTCGLSIYNELTAILKEQYFLPINEMKSGIYDVFSRRLLGYDIYKSGTNIKFERHVYERRDYYHNWHESSIERVNKEYHITKAGVLNKKDYAILFENADERHHIPVEATEQLNIYNEVTLTNSVIQTLYQESIRLGIYNKYGDLLGYFVPENYYQDSRTALAQCVEYMDIKRRVQVAKTMEIAAIHNIRSNVRYYMKKSNMKEELHEIEQYLSEGITKLNQAATT